MEEKKIVAATLAAALLQPIGDLSRARDETHRQSLEQLSIDRAISLYQRILAQLPD